MTVLLAAPVLMNAPLAQFLKAQSILSIPAFVLTAALAPMFAPRALSLRANNPRKQITNKRYPLQGAAFF